MRLFVYAIIVFLAATSVSLSAVILDPVPELPKGLPELKKDYTRVTVSGKSDLGPMPQPWTDISQGAETGDPNFYIQMSEMLGKMGGKLVRCDPFSDTRDITVTPEGKVEIDFTAADAICDALARAGAKPVWNIACFPDEMLDGDRPIADLLDQYVYQVTYHWNVEQKRGIKYFEYWNEPPGLDGPMFAVAVKAAHRADPSVKVGGPAIMGCSVKVLEDTVKYCVENDVKLGFLSFHLYYEMPDGYLKHIENVEEMLKKYPGYEDLEMLLTEWGVDAGLNGSCDTLYNAAYYSAIMEAVMHKWPKIRPMHFEFRDGWDPVGPSRDLWGRWGMVTYPNLLPKPVYNAGVMWNKLAETQIRAESSNPDVRVIAAKNDHKVTILIWSWPHEYRHLLAKAPDVTRSLTDTPVKIRVDDIPFDSQGIRYRRWVVDQTTSNVHFDPYSPELQKVHDVNLARTGPERGNAPEKGIPIDSFETELVLPLHSVTMIELLPEERPALNFIAEADRWNIWAGERAKVTLLPKYDEELDMELILDQANRLPWKIEKISDKPLSFYVEPPASDVKSMRYFSVWARNKKSRAIGQAVLEFQTDSPAALSLAPDHIDISPVLRKGEVSIDVVNKTPDQRDVKVVWDTPTGIKAVPASPSVRLAPGATSQAKATVEFEPGMTPNRYFLTARLVAGGELSSVSVPVSLALQSPRVKKPVTLDGDLSEWEQLPSVRVGSSEDFDGHSYREWGGDDDISGRIWTQWDDENLYFAFRVMDDEHVQKINTWEMKNWDSVHISFDLARDSLDPREFFDRGDCDYVLGLWDGTAYAYRHWGASRPMDFADGVQIAARRVGKFTTYEVAMNWKKEFVPFAEPKVGEIIGCSVYLRDYDEGKAKAEMRWGRGLHWDQKRPALYNSIWLTD